MNTDPTTSERNVSKTREEICREAQRMEESLLFSSKGHFNDATICGWMHLALGLPMVVLAAIAGASAFSQFDKQGTLAGVLSVVVVVLSSISTFLNANKRASEHLNAGNKYDALLNKVRIFRTIECWEHDADQMLTDQIKRLSEDKNTLNQSSPQVSWFAYKMTKKGIEKGEASYQADKELPAS